MYVCIDPDQREYYIGIKRILTELKALASEHKEAIVLSDDDWCLFNDLCNDLDVED